jgi:hypothetical protein
MLCSQSYITSCNMKVLQYNYIAVYISLYIYVVEECLDSVEWEWNSGMVE